MIMQTNPHVKRYCWHCGELLNEDKHIVWFSVRSEAMNLHVGCAMLMARGLLANVHDAMKGITEGNQEDVTDAR